MVDATTAESPAAQKKTLPTECLKRLQKFDEALTSLEVALAPVLAVGFEDHMKVRRIRELRRGALCSSNWFAFSDQPSKWLKWT